MSKAEFENFIEEQLDLERDFEKRLNQSISESKNKKLIPLENILN